MAAPAQPEPGRDPRISEEVDWELLWLQHGKKIITGVVAVAVVVFAVVMWRRHAAEQAVAAAARLAAARDVGALEQIIADYPRQEVAAQALLKLADRLYHTGQHEQAAQKYRLFLEQFSAHPLAGAARLGLAAAAEARGDWQQALQEYQTIREGAGAEFAKLPAILGMARCLEAMGNVSEARQRYEEAVAIGQGTPAQMSAYVRWLVLSRQLPAAVAEGSNSKPVGETNGAVDTQGFEIKPAGRN